MNIITLKYPRTSYPRFNYSCINPSKPVIHCIPMGGAATVEVVGDGDNGCYEWIIRNVEGVIITHSDDGYGQWTVALRDGLMVYHRDSFSGQAALDAFINSQHTEERL